MYCPLCDEDTETWNGKCADCKASRVIPEDTRPYILTGPRRMYVIRLGPTPQGRGYQRTAVWGPEGATYEALKLEFLELPTTYGPCPCKTPPDEFMKWLLKKPGWSVPNPPIPYARLHEAEVDFKLKLESF